MASGSGSPVTPRGPKVISHLRTFGSWQGGCRLLSWQALPVRQDQERSEALR
jgi:hypothetical protein